MASTTTNHAFRDPANTADTIDFTGDFDWKQKLDDILSALATDVSGATNSVGGTSYASNAGKIISSATSSRSKIIGKSAADNATLTFQDHPADPTTGTDKAVIGYHDVGDGFAINFSTSLEAALADNDFYVQAGLVGVAGTLELLGAQTIRTTTGVLTIATNGGNGNIVLRPNGTGDVVVDSTSGDPVVQFQRATVAKAQILVGTTDTYFDYLGKIILRSGIVGTDRVFIESGGSVTPAANDVGALGSATLSWSDLFLALGGVINFNNGDVTITHSADTLAFAGAATAYTFDSAVRPSANDAAALGASGTAWSDLFLASGAVINFSASDITLTHSSNLLTLGGGDFLVSGVFATNQTPSATIQGLFASLNSSTNGDLRIVRGGNDYGLSFKVTASSGFPTIDSIGDAAGVLLKIRMRTAGTPVVAQVIDASGFTAFGADIDPATVIDAQGADSSTVITVRINAAQASITTADTFVDFRSTTGSEGTIAGTAVAGVLAYNTFTGSHFTQIDEAIQPLMLVEATGESISGWVGSEFIRDRTTSDGVRKIVRGNHTASIKEQVVKSRICRTRQSAAAWGFYLGRDKEGRDMIAALGTGFALVWNTGTPVSIGDYFVSSSEPGYVELQGDNVLKNVTVAKSIQRVIWNMGEKWRRVAVTYHCG